VSKQVDPLANAKPSVRAAWAQRELAQQHQPEIPVGQPGDRQAHDWLRQHGDGDERPVDDFDTWSRYLRDARTTIKGGRCRRGRQHGSSIAESDQL